MSSDNLRRMRETVAGSASIIDWLNVAQQVKSTPRLPGDPGGLRSVAATLRGGGNEIDTVRQDLDRVRTDKLPTVWTGMSALAASKACAALTNRMADIDAVFRDTAGSVQRLADAIEQAVRRFENGRSAVAAAIALQAHLGPADYRRIQEGMVHGLDDMVGAATTHEDATMDAARYLRSIADRATASKMATSTLSPIEKVLIASTDILTASDAAQAAKNLNSWDFGARMRFIELMETGGSDEELAWLFKAVGAGHSMDEVAAFDSVIRVHASDTAWLTSHLRPLDPNATGDARFMGVSLTQFDGTTCGTMNLLLNHAMRDPIYAIELSNVSPPVAPGEEQRIIGDRLVAEQKRIQDETNNGLLIFDWPQGLGTHPDDAANWLSHHSGGIEYDWHRSILGADTSGQVATTVDAAAAGNPSMLLIGNGYPDHYVMVVGETTTGVTVYNPATGRVTELPMGDLTREHMSAVSDRDTIYAVITPTGG